MKQWNFGNIFCSFTKTDLYSVHTATKPDYDLFNFMILNLMHMCIRILQTSTVLYKFSMRDHKIPTCYVPRENGSIPSINHATTAYFLFCLFYACSDVLNGLESPMA